MFFLSSSASSAQLQPVVSSPTHLRPEKLALLLVPLSADPRLARLLHDIRLGPQPQQLRALAKLLLQAAALYDRGLAPAQPDEPPDPPALLVDGHARRPRHGAGVLERPVAADLLVVEGGQVVELLVRQEPVGEQGPREVGVCRPRCHLHQRLQRQRQLADLLGQLGVPDGAPGADPARGVSGRGGLGCDLARSVHVSGSSGLADAEFIVRPGRAVAGTAGLAILAALGWHLRARPALGRFFLFLVDWRLAALIP